MNIKEIKGVGPKTITLLSKLNIITLQDLIQYYPYRYNILDEVNLEDTVNDSGLINGTIESIPQVSYFKGRFNRLSFRLLTNERVINVSIFNRAYLKNQLLVGKKISVIGKYNEEKNSFLASDIKLTEVVQKQIEPVYHLVSGLSNSQMNKILINSLDTKIDVEDYIPKEFVDKYHFFSKEEAIRQLHDPVDINHLKLARLRAIYEEFFVFMFKMNYLKLKRIQGDYGFVRKINYNKVEEFMDNLPFTLTKDQLKAVNEIYEDFTTKKRMNRLVLGDVGSGKTLVSIIAMYMNYLGGYQAVLMAPTEILARQHYEVVSKMFPDVRIGLLVGSMLSASKTMVKGKLKKGEFDILIGTHAVLEEDVIFNNLGLVITDEQHRFGVNQRKMIQNKGTKTDVLYMSATPIPRTYALSLYGDMDLSMIKSKPKGRKEIVTIVKKEKEIKDVLDAVYRELRLGHQVFIIAPLIEDENDTNQNDVSKLAEKYRLAFGEKYNIGTLHGKMRKDDKNEVMERYKRKEIDILISTTVVEVGIDIPNATLMVIYNAERFGLATLHQLRGRVGRNEFTSYCYLICNKDIDRLKVLEESNDGFYISEKDFEMRGEGDLFGIKQSGDMVFKVGDIKRDYKILMQCRKDSEEYLKHFDNNPFYESIISNLDINN